MSNANLRLVYQNKAKISFKSLQPVYLLCVFRDEIILLDYFIQYYKNLGVTHFIMIDNLSVDNGVNYLKQLKDTNIMIYCANGSYRDAGFGTKWINQLLEKHCVSQYCLTVDADELFYFDRNRFFDLQKVISVMESKNSNVIPVSLLDMYPKIINNGYKKGGDFLVHSQFFDQYNPSYYNSGSKIYKSFSHKTGGVRKRVFNKTVCIHKFPFFRYDFNPIGVAPGYHFFQDDNGVVLQESESIRLFDEPQILLHFKFLKPNLGDFFKRRVALNQDWDDSAEYESYVATIKENSSLEMFDEDYSEKMLDSKSLKSFFNSCKS